MTKVQIISDLHIDSRPNVKTTDIEQQADSLIIAGDISDNCKESQLFVRQLIKSHDFKDILVVLGNHDYWDKEKDWFNIYGDWVSAFNKTIVSVAGPPGIFFIGDKSAYAGTGWATCNEYTEDKDYWDFRYIKSFGDKMFTAEEEKQLRNLFIEKADMLHRNRTTVDIIVSHHAPMADVIDPKYVEDGHEAYFSGEYASIADKLEAKFWVFGHSHMSFHKKIGNTTYVSCPSGIYKYDSDSCNIRSKTIEL